MQFKFQCRDRNHDELIFNVEAVDEATARSNVQTRGLEIIAIVPAEDMQPTAVPQHAIKTDEWIESNGSASPSYLFLWVGIVLCLTGPLPLMYARSTLSIWPHRSGVEQIIASVIGESVVYAGVACLFIFWLRSGFAVMQKPGIAACVLGIVIWSVSIREAARTYDLSAAQRTRDEIRSTIRDAIDKKPVAPHQSDARLGKYNVLASVMKAWMQDVQGLGIEYAKERDAINPTLLLSASQVDSLAELADSERLIQKWQIKIRDVAKRYPVVLDSIRDRIRNSSMDAETRNSAFRGVNESLEKSKRQIEMYYGVQEAMAITFAEAISLLKSRFATYTVENGQIHFSNPQDIDAFNAIIDRMSDLSLKETALLQEFLQQATKTAGAMEPGVAR